MAKSLENISFYMTSANSEFDANRLAVRYSVVDGDLSKVTRWQVSGIDLDQSVSGVWDDTIAAIATIEGV